MTRHEKKFQKLIILCSIICALLTIGISSSVKSVETFSLSQVIESRLSNNY